LSSIGLLELVVHQPHAIAGKELNSTNDLVQLQGKWKLTGVGIQGRSAHTLTSQTWTFTGNQLTKHMRSASGDKKEWVLVYSVRLDPSQTPKHFDLLSKSGAIFRRCIYRIKGDKLFICESTDALRRPKDWSIKKGTNQTGYIYERIKRDE
jgi:uncharacterized protein (TIGR03067 family)